MQLELGTAGCGTHMCPLSVELGMVLLQMNWEVRRNSTPNTQLIAPAKNSSTFLSEWWAIDRSARGAIARALSSQFSCLGISDPNWAASSPFLRRVNSNSTRIDQLKAVELAVGVNKTAS